MPRRTPYKIQSNQLRRLLGRAAHTEWGQRFGFSHIAQQSDVIKAYQSQVPIHTYEDLKPFVDRIRAGEEDILWPGKIRHFAISSGTASAGKVIPVSLDMLHMTRKFPLRLI
ncbi:MAG: GH3 auxin-responsive promoter family protein, partial [Bacteroidetes bacterium]|nr:GH3 auxin-responsive promoter family protein [Bacteroidota bacterium]